MHIKPPLSFDLTKSNEELVAQIAAAIGQVKK
ncbi:MAG: Uncharacterised protein [Bacteroidota bacterium]|nr:MAG: Uncharacterised protein [Bacteroidota bacterium]